MLTRPAVAALIIFCAPLGADTETAPNEIPGLSQLAAAADVIALVQVRDTDYRLKREIPVSGSAYLAVLIPYKMNRDTDLVEVYEKGLHEGECYFPNPTVFEEGRRFLVFLQQDEESPELYRGLTQGCALEVLVRDDNRYAVRYPADGIVFRDDLDALAAPMAFADPYALVEDENLSPEARNAMLAAGQIEPHGKGVWRYTMGIDLAALRRHIGREALED